jgi:hypothetical protein
MTIDVIVYLSAMVSLPPLFTSKWGKIIRKVTELVTT